VNNLKNNLGQNKGKWIGISTLLAGYLVVTKHESWIFSPMVVGWEGQKGGEHHETLGFEEPQS